MSFQCNQFSLDSRYVKGNAFVQSQADQDIDRLKELLLENGYLYFPQFFPQSQVVKLRESYFLESSETDEYGIKGHAAFKFVRSENFISFTENNALKSLAEKILGEPSVLLNRRILRHYNQKTIKASPAHIDFSYLCQGDDQLITAWVPVGDCSVDSGGLIYLEKSHDLNFTELKKEMNETQSKISLSSDLNKVAQLTGRKWLSQDFKAGDLILHNPYIIHATLNCQNSYDRLSMDLRFIGQSKKEDPRWQNNWSADDGY